MQVGIIINPIAGTNTHRTVDARVKLARTVLSNKGIEGQVIVTDGPGHARSIARELVEQSVETVVAWGGDGTFNEVASQVAFSGTAIGLVPAGSGNGFARELLVDWEPSLALEIALCGDIQWIDIGEFGGRLFFNVAGVGFDAHMATMFNAKNGCGSFQYFMTTLRELAIYKPKCYTLKSDQTIMTKRALVIAVANTRQYGNRAIIAPMARPDDGLLELVVLPALSPLSRFWHAPRLFTGSVHRLPDAWIRSLRTLEISADCPLSFHVDGECFIGPRHLSVKVHPRALPIRTLKR